MNRPTVRAYSTSSVGQTKIRATTSAAGLSMAARHIGRRRSAASQFTIAPSASAPARRSICGRNAASRTGGTTAGGLSSLKRLIVNVSNSPSTRSPASAVRTKRSTSRVLRNGSVKSRPFQSPTIAGLEAPRPSTNRPGAAAAMVAADIAIRAGPRVNVGTIAVPRRRVGSQTEASASGMNASVPLTSADQTSV